MSKLDDIEKKLDKHYAQIDLILYGPDRRGGLIREVERLSTTQKIELAILGSVGVISLSGIITLVLNAYAVANALAKVGAYGP